MNKILKFRSLNEPLLGNLELKQIFDLNQTYDVIVDSVKIQPICFVKSLSQQKQITLTPKPHFIKLIENAAVLLTQGICHWEIQILTNHTKLLVKYQNINAEVYLANLIGEMIPLNNR